MNNNLKRTIVSFSFIILTLFSSLMVFALDESYDSYYEFTAGVFTRSHTYSNASNGMSIELFPNDGNAICNMEVMVMKKVFWGHDVVSSIKSVSANEDSYSSFRNLPTNIELKGYVTGPGYKLTGRSTIRFWE